MYWDWGFLFLLDWLSCSTKRTKITFDHVADSEFGHSVVSGELAALWGVDRSDSLPPPTFL